MHGHRRSLNKGGTGVISQGRAKKLKLGLCAHVPPQKVVEKKLKIWRKTQDAYRLTVNVIFFSAGLAAGNRSSTLKSDR